MQHDTKEARTEIDACDLHFHKVLIIIFLNMVAK